jgi:hypothetical protein
MKFRKKPLVIEATQWFKMGDHEEVREYEYNNDVWCDNCVTAKNRHGWIDTLEGGHIVCPGDWIITGVQGEHYPCKPDIFEQTYEKASEKKNNKNDVFVGHIKQHLKKLGLGIVVCKICAKTIDEIYKEQQ